MRLTFIANACCIYELNGFRLLTDPWLVDGAFAGSWCHYPPLKTKPEDVAGVDAVYISHVHPDHLDPQTLKAFRRDTLLLVLDHGGNYTRKKLQSLGFTNILGIKDKQRVPVGPFSVTMYAPFVGNTFEKSVLGNLIDSAIVVESPYHSIFNANDNRPDEAAAIALRARHGRFTVAQLPYNLAGPFPSCYTNLTDDQKRTAAGRLMVRSLEQSASVARLLAPKYLMPFAGQYVLGGSQWRKNETLNTITWDAAASAWSELAPGSTPLVLSEGMTADLSGPVLAHEGHAPIDRGEQSAYIESFLSALKYPHEADAEPVDDELHNALMVARANLWRKQVSCGYQPVYIIYLKIGSAWFRFNLANQETMIVEKLPSASQFPYMAAAMDRRLLMRIAAGKENWNNADVGCHIDYFRDPDAYMPDVHTIMAFFGGRS